MTHAALRHRRRPRAAAGMTLLEMLLVIALVAVSASLAVMASEVVVGIRRLIDSNPCDMTEQDVEAIYRSIY